MTTGQQQYEATEGLASEGSIKPVCNCCELLKEMLEKETQEKKFLQMLVLERGGFIAKDTGYATDTTEWPIYNKGITLSGLRAKLEADHSRPAEDKEKTPAEIAFEKSLGNSNEVQ
jgi:hypothetical protein